MAGKKVYEKHEKFEMNGTKEGKRIEKSEKMSDKKMGAKAPMKATKRGK